MTIPARNYAAQAEMGLINYAERCNGSIDHWREQKIFAEKLASGISISKHFSIPHYKEVREALRGPFRADLDSIEEGYQTINIPYPEITIESDMSDPNETKEYTDKIVVFATQQDNLIHVLSAVHVTPKRGWHPFFAGFTMGCDFSVYREFAPCPTHYQKILGELGEEETFERMGLGITLGKINLYYLTIALRQRGAKIQTIQKEHPNNPKRIKNGKIPFYETKTITIDTSRPVALAENAGYPSHHVSPRYHDRRGHERVLSSGKVVWVKSCKVGNPLRGLITKNYKVV